MNEKFDFISLCDLVRSGCFYSEHIPLKVNGKKVIDAKLNGYTIELITE